MRVLVTLQFIVWVNLVPLHLATEPHLDHGIHPGLSGGTLAESAHRHSHSDADHAPHLASDHSLDLVKRGTGIAFQPATATALSWFEPDSTMAISSLHPAEAPQPAGRAPPGPLGSRAPPPA